MALSPEAGRHLHVRRWQWHNKYRLFSRMDEEAISRVLPVLKVINISKAAGFNNPADRA